MKILAVIIVACTALNGYHLFSWTQGAFDNLPFLLKMAVGFAFLFGYSSGVYWVISTLESA
jgi:hypothetical protein